MLRGALGGACAGLLVEVNRRDAVMTDTEVQIRRKCSVCLGSDELEIVEFSHGREVTKPKRDWCHKCKGGWVYEWVPFAVGTPL